MGESIEPLARQLVPREVYDLLNTMSRASEEATLPRVVSGQAPGGVSAGFAINLLTQGGRLALYPIENATNDLIGDAASIVYGLIEQGKRTVTLDDDLQIETKDAKAYRYRTTAKLRASIPTD